MNQNERATLFSSATDEWATPQELFDALDAEFHFTLDPCSTDQNAKCAKHYTKAQNGLAQDWTGETVWCNPPYGRDVGKWIRKCYEHFMGGVQQSCFSRPGRTPKSSTNTFTARQKSGLSGAVSNLETVNTTRRSRP